MGRAGAGLNHQAKSLEWGQGGRTQHHGNRTPPAAESPRAGWAETSENLDPEEMRHWGIGFSKGELSHSPHETLRVSDSISLLTPKENEGIMGTEMPKRGSENSGAHYHTRATDTVGEGDTTEPRKSPRGLSWKHSVRRTLSSQPWLAPSLRPTRTPSGL